MRRYLFLALLLALLLTPPVSSQPVLVLKVSPKSVEGFPGQTLVVNVTIKNVGNETARNVTIIPSIPLKGSSSLKNS